MTTTVRTFIAIELSPDARAALTALQNRLKAMVPPHTVRWTNPANIHLTLHFLGDVAAGDVNKVAAALQAAAAEAAAFSLTLAGLGCFPNTRRPRIVWVGVQGDTGLLVDVHKDLGRRLRVINFTPEARPYAPHLTIGRVKKGIRSHQLAQLGEILAREQPGVGRLATLAVQEICLIKSDLKPSGPVYTPLATSRLAKPA